MSRRRTARWAVLFLAALAVTTACAPEGSTPTTATTGSTSGTRGSSTSATSGTTTPEPPPTTPDDPSLEYLPWGPEDPPIPEEYANLAASGGQPARCSDLEASMPESDFWEVALGVCQALFEGGSWPEAASVPPAPTAESPFQACLDDELTAFLEDALAWHAAHPGEDPQVALPGAIQLSPCQVRIYEVQVLDAGHYDLVGTPPEGVPVAIFFSDAGTGDPTVSVDGQPAPDVTGDFWADGPEGVGMAEVVVLVPPREEAGPAPVEVRTTRGAMSTTVDLPAGSTTGTPSEDPGPSPSEEDPDPSPSPDASPSASDAPDDGGSST